MSKEERSNPRQDDGDSSPVTNQRRSPRVSRGKMILRPDGMQYQNRVFSESTSRRVLIRRIASQTANKAWLETVDVIVNVANGSRTLQIVRWRARNQKEPPKKFWGYVRHFNVRSWPQWYAAAQGVEKYLDRVKTLDDKGDPRIDISQTDLINISLETKDLKVKLDENRKLQEFQRSQLEDVKRRIREMRQHLTIYRRIVQDLQRLVIDPKTIETQIHQFINESEAPWLFGLEYISLESKVRFPPESKVFEFDLMLQRYDGFNDLVELKGPNEQLFIRKTDRRVAFSQKLSEALGQSMVYLAECDRSDNLKIFRPRAIIVIGNKNTDDERQRRMVTSHFARIEVITYSDLIKKAEQLLKHIQGGTKKQRKK